MKKTLLTTMLVVITVLVTTVPQIYADHDERKNGSQNLAIPPTLGKSLDGKVIVNDGFSINGKSYQVQYTWQEIPTHEFSLGEPIEIRLKIHDEKGAERLAHAALYLNADHDRGVGQGLTSIIWDVDHLGTESIQTEDPEGILDDVNVKAKVIDANVMEIKYSFKITKPLTEKNIVVRTWDDDRVSWDNYFFNAIATENNPLKQNKQELVCIENQVLMQQEDTGKLACVLSSHVAIWEKYGWYFDHN